MGGLRRVDKACKKMRCYDVPGSVKKIVLR